MAKMTISQLLAKANKGTKRKISSDEEHRLQAACVRWFNLQYPQLEGRLFAVPNGGRRDAVTGAKLKAEGVVPGVSDLILLKRNRHYGALLIEMKTSKGRLSPWQKLWRWAVCRENEYKYVVCRSLEDFIREVSEYLSNM